MWFRRKKKIYILYKKCKFVEVICCIMFVALAIFFLSYMCFCLFNFRIILPLLRINNENHCAQNAFSFKHISKQKLYLVDITFLLFYKIIKYVHNYLLLNMKFLHLYKINKYTTLDFYFWKIWFQKMFVWQCHLIKIFLHMVYIKYSTLFVNSKTL